MTLLIPGPKMIGVRDYNCDYGRKCHVLRAIWKKYHDIKMARGEMTSAGLLTKGRSSEPPQPKYEAVSGLGKSTE